MHPFGFDFAKLSQTFISFSNSKLSISRATFRKVEFMRKIVSFTPNFFKLGETKISTVCYTSKITHYFAFA